MADIRGAKICLSCESGECPSKKDKSLGNMWGDTFHHIGAENGRYFGVCEVCNHERPYTPKQPMRYNGSPDFSTGRVFGSRQEQRDFAKKNKLREI